MEDFKKQAIDLLSRIVNSRLYCLKKNIGVAITKAEYAPIVAQYAAYKHKWTEQGVARFIVRNQETLRTMSKRGTQANELNNLIKHINETYNIPVES